MANPMKLLAGQPYGLRKWDDVPIYAKPANPAAPAKLVATVHGGCMEPAERDALVAQVAASSYVTAALKMVRHAGFSPSRDDHMRALIDAALAAAEGK